MPRKSSDANTISNDHREIEQAAKTCNVPAYVILLAKHETQSNNRAEVYAWIDRNKGIDLVFNFKTAITPYDKKNNRKTG